MREREKEEERNKEKRKGNITMNVEVGDNKLLT